ncbi:MAG: PCRF domain-containing protein [Patescibacteria group bacterium]
MSEENKKRIAEIENLMQQADFWVNKEKAKELVKELNILKEDDGALGYDNKEAIITIFAGAGGDDAEDFASILYEMYQKYFKKRAWESYLIHKNENDHGGFRNITFEIKSRGAYGELKNESGVHRLVRISPFNASKKRHTSFAMVEVIPKFEKLNEMPIPEDELKVDFARSSGPGGQNVNKRETSVRITHIPTNLSVHVESERSQAQNREKAMQLLSGKLFKLREEERIAKEKGMYISKTTKVEWGNQIRSYVLHPYKLVKDHRSNVEVHDTEKVLSGGLEPFLKVN